MDQQLLHTDPAAAQQPAVMDNISDDYLALFQSSYEDDSITKDDIWVYIYGVMHAPDWREKYKHDLQKNLPRIPLAADFRAFCVAGRELMDLHVGYETCPEQKGVVCEVDGLVVDDEGQPTDVIPGTASQPEAEAWRIIDRMRWGTPGNSNDRSTLRVNDRCTLSNIPPEAHKYKVSGRSPLEWAVDSLRRKEDKDSGIVDDPNGWEAWKDDPFELIRHLRRLAYVGVRSSEIIAALPPSLDGPIGPDGVEMPD